MNTFTRIWLARFCIISLTLGTLLVGCSRKKGADAQGFDQLMNSGKNYYEKGQPERAVEQFAKAVALQPANVDAQLNLANAYLLQGDPTNAVRHADEAIQLNNDLAAAHYVRGCAQLRMANADEAIKSLNTCYDLNPSVAAAAFQLARAHVEAGHLDEGISYFQAALEIEPEHPAANYALAQALLRAGRQAEAAPVLEKHRQVTARQPNQAPSPATFERSQYTAIRTQFKLEEPDEQGIKVAFVDMSESAFGGKASGLAGPIGIIDFRHDGRNSLVAREGTGFRLLENTGGKFQNSGSAIPAIPEAKYGRALVGDIHNDRLEDVLLLSDKGCQVLRIGTNGMVSEATPATLRNVPAADGVIIDLDFTGKLDLLTIDPTNRAVHVLRNLGNTFFFNITATSGVPSSLQGVEQITLDDWNGDDILDLFAVRRGQAPTLLAKPRGGALTQTNAALPVASRIELGDFNNDLRTDALLVQDAKLEIVLNGVDRKISLAVDAGRAKKVFVFDYDNDGWLNVVCAGAGLQVWRNQGAKGFRDVTETLGLQKLKNSLADVRFADFDGDGDSEMLLVGETGGLTLLRNDGGNKNQQLKLRLAGNRSNASALGVRVESSAGGLRNIRTVHQLPIEIGMGKYKTVETLTVRWFDLAVSTADLVVDARPIKIDELTIPGGSCPYLYAWNGSRFRFVTDLLCAAPIGLRLSDTRFIDADTDEFVWIGNDEMFRPRDGNYLLQITEELREVLYLDEAKMLVVDHPPGTEIHTTFKLRAGKPFPKPELVTLKNSTSPKRAVRNDGLDVTEIVRDRDERYASPVKLRVPQLRGLAEPFHVEFEFAEGPTGEQTVLLLSGWLRFGGGMANVAGSHNPELPFPFPQLEAQATDGAWKKIDVDVGAPAGKPKTIMVDLRGKLPAGAKKFRLSTAFEIHWDRIALMERAGEEQTRVHWSAPTGTDLHWRGYSEFEDRDWTHPLTPAYEKVQTRPLWRITPSGWVTRYGEVNELIGKKDNALALIAGGDELTLSFPETSLPKKSDGALRQYFLYSVGWDKDADFHVASGWTVGPMPWHGMDDQRYGYEERPATLDKTWMGKFNRRWVGLLTIDRPQRSAKK